MGFFQDDIGEYSARLSILIASRCFPLISISLSQTISKSMYLKASFAATGRSFSDRDDATIDAAALLQWDFEAFRRGH